MAKLESIGGSISIVVTEENPGLTLSINDDISQINIFPSIEIAINDFEG